MNSKNQKGKNTTKIVIIILAVLLVVISIFAVPAVLTGVFMFNTASGVADDTVSSIDNMGMTMFNAQFEQYIGKSQRFSMAQGLIDKVIFNNSQGANAISIISVELNGLDTQISATSEETKLKELRGLIKSSSKYDIEVAEYTKDGAISKITITQTVAGNSSTSNVVTE